MSPRRNGFIDIRWLYQTIIGLQFIYYIIRSVWIDRAKSSYYTKNLSDCHGYL